MLVFAVHRLTEAAERLRRLHCVAVGVLGAVRHDQGILRVLIQELVRFDVQRIAGRIPHDLIDTDHMVAVLLVIHRVAEIDQEDILAGDRVDIDRSVERHRQPGLQVEAIQRVENLGVLVVRAVGDGVGQGQVDVQAGVLGVVRHGKPVAGERCFSANIQMEERVNLTCVLMDFRFCPGDRGADGFVPACHSRQYCRWRSGR